MTSHARAVALRCLFRIDHEGAFAHLVVPAELAASRLDERDRRFVTGLVYGTTRRRRACDAAVDRFIAADPEPLVRTVLRLGAYQLLFAGVPPHAAVGETVRLAPRRARGFVNAILRRVVDVPMVWGSRAEELSYPDWIVETLEHELGPSEAYAMLATMNEPATATSRPDGYIQDLASQWVAASVEAVIGETVLDMCAGPGGKATAIASSGATVVAGDSQVHRAGLVAENARRLGLENVVVVVADATRSPFADRTFDHVLVDAPCSGLGVLRRRADARWRLDERHVEELAALQRRILADAARLVRPGGRLVYSVCTVLDAESIDHPTPSGFDVDGARPVGEWRAHGHGWRVLPHEHGTDGMVLIRYRRQP